MKDRNMKFQDGQKIKSLQFGQGDMIIATEENTIEVSMENGQMAGVAWAVQKVGSQIFKHNLALVETVEMEA